MIISHKYKFLFIGLPFSASSAITKDLNEKYEGQAYLRKHSVYQEFAKVATQNEKNYFVFAVLRNPMEIAVTKYLKMKANTKGNFTNPRLFIENGGHISVDQRRRYDFIKEKNATFQQYFLKYYKKPYDNLYSRTLDNCDFVIRYENISKDYVLALREAGINNPSPLPVMNKTTGKKEDLVFYYSEDIRKKAIAVFGPYMQKYNYHFPNQWGTISVPLASKLKFKIFSVMRIINEQIFKKKSYRKSISGTIYGDIQREKEI